MPHDSSTPPIRGASFWVRAAAHMVDLSLALLLGLMIAVPIVLRTGNLAAPASIPLWIEIPVDLAFTVGIVALWRFAQSTPGKMLLKLKIVDSRTGGRPSWLRLIARYFGYLIAWLPVIPFGAIIPGYQSPYGESPLNWLIGIPLCLGYWWILIDPRRRGWHDLISGTVTVPVDSND